MQKSLGIFRPRPFLRCACARPVHDRKPLACCYLQVLGTAVVQFVLCNREVNRHGKVLFLCKYCFRSFVSFFFCPKSIIIIQSPPCLLLLSICYTSQNMLKFFLVELVVIVFVLVCFLYISHFAHFDVFEVSDCYITCIFPFLLILFSIVHIPYRSVKVSNFFCLR